LLHLSVIAGPNGAGKSTNSKVLLDLYGIAAFDYDFEFYNSWKKFSYDPLVENGIRERTNKLFVSRKDHSLKTKSSFGFETNYHLATSTEIVKEFGEAGFTTEIIFIALESAEMALERVAHRVAKGGHFVDELTIRQRFTQGLQQFDATFHYYDFVTLYLSEQNHQKLIFTLSPKLKISYQMNEIPSSLKNQLPRLYEFTQNLNE
jgi:predicted ABC-type ATPase